MLGGINLQITAGAVPGVPLYGLVVSVPPVMFVLWPAPDRLVLFHVVTNVSVVRPALTAAVTTIVSPVYGELTLFNWNKVVADAPAVNEYHPVVVASVVCVPPVPLRRVVPVYDWPPIVCAAPFTRPLMYNCPT